MQYIRLIVCDDFTLLAVGKLCGGKQTIHLALHILIYCCPLKTKKSPIMCPQCP